LTDLGAAAELGTLLSSLRLALVEVTEFLAAKRGRAAGDTVGFWVIAERIRHGCLVKIGYSLLAIRYSQKLKRQLIQAVGMPSARSNGVRAGTSVGNLRVVTLRFLKWACQEKSEKKWGGVPVLGKEMEKNQNRPRIGADHADLIFVCALPPAACAQAFGRVEWVLFSCLPSVATLGYDLPSR
jgi:hypothetical protein